MSSKDQARLEFEQLVYDDINFNKMWSDNFDEWYNEVYLNEAA